MPNFKVKSFKIWYKGGKKWSSVSDGRWDFAPDDGVIGIMVYFEDHVPPGQGKERNSRQYYSGGDIYFSDGDQLFGYNRDDMLVNEKRYPQCTFKRGVWVSVEEYHEVNQMASDDKEF